MHPIIWVDKFCLRRCRQKLIWIEVAKKDLLKISLKPHATLKKITGEWGFIQLTPKLW